MRADYCGGVCFLIKIKHVALAKGNHDAAIIMTGFGGRVATVISTVCTQAIEQVSPIALQSLWFRGVCNHQYMHRTI